MIFEPPFTAPMTSVTGEVMEGAAPDLGILTPTERAAPPTKIASAAGRWDIPAMPRLGAPERAEQAMATGALRTGAPRLSGRDIMKTLFLDKDWAKMSAAEEMNRRAVETEAWIAQQPPEMQPQLASILAPRITAAREAYAKMQKEQELTAQEQGKGRALEALSPEERLRAQAGQPFGEAMRMPLEVQKEANIGAANVANINAAAEVTSATKQADAIIEANRINRQGMIDQARIGNQGALMEVMMKSYQQDLSQGMPWEIAYHRNQAVAKSWISGQPIEMPPEMKKREEDWLSSYRDFQIRLKRGDADDIIFQKAVEATKDMDLADREEFLQMIQSMLRSRGTMPEGGPPPGAPTSGAEVPYGPETRPSIGQEASQMLGELGSVYGDLYGGSSAPMGSALYPFAWTQAALGRAGEALGNWASSQPNPYGLGPLPFPPGVKPPGVR